MESMRIHLSVGSGHIKDTLNDSKDSGQDREAIVRDLGR